MDTARPKVAIVYLSYHCEPYLDEVVDSLERLTYPKECLELVVVDNPHPEHGSSVEAIERSTASRSGTTLPRTTILPQKENLGFSHGVNAGIRWAVENDCDYVYLHNDDGTLSPGALEPLVEAMEQEHEIAAAQSLMLLNSERHLVNSAGNALHYCFFGYCDRYRESVDTLDLPAVSDIAFASGAASLLRVEYLKSYGGLDEDYFFYCEDLEYCCRMRLAGHRIVLVKDSQFYHRYRFDRNDSKLYFLDRNRFAVMLTTLRWPTLLVLLPIVLPLEVALFLFSWRRGWLSTRLKVYRYWSERRHWKLWISKRRRTQGLRRISDRRFMQSTVSLLRFDEQAVRSWVLTYVGNPVMSFYYHLVVRSLLWG